MLPDRVLCVKYKSQRWEIVLDIQNVKMLIFMILFVDESSKLYIKNIFHSKSSEFFC